MEYTSEFDSTNGICTVHVTGEFHRPVDSDKLKRFAVDFSVEHGCFLFLIDLTQAEVTGGTTATFDAANPQGAIADGLRKIKTAFVRRELTEDDLFYENVAVNRGFQLRALDTVEKATEWLMENANSSTWQPNVAYSVTRARFTSILIETLYTHKVKWHSGNQKISYIQ